MRQYTLASLFDGIGGFPYAASFYNITSLWASEIVPACVSVTKRHFPDMAHAGDVTQLHGGKLPPVDIVTFGSPCQGLSMAGQRRGLADERSGLFMEAIRIIDEMRELIISGAYANDTPLQPQSERSKRRRQWVGPRENHAGVKVPWC